MRLTTFALLPALAFLLDALPAQYGFLFYNGGGAGGAQVVSGCGFNCSDPANVLTMNAAGGSYIHYQIQGDAGAFGGVLISIGPGLGVCPGLPFSGIANSLVLNPAPTHTAIMALTTSITATPNATCGATGGQRIVQFFTLPAWLSGTTLSFQGFAIDSGAPTFTRSIEVTIT